MTQGTYLLKLLWEFLNFRKREEKKLSWPQNSPPLFKCWWMLSKPRKKDFLYNPPLVKPLSHLPSFLFRHATVRVVAASLKGGSALGLLRIGSHPKDWLRSFEVLSSLGCSPSPSCLPKGHLVFRSRLVQRLENLDTRFYMTWVRSQIFKHLSFVEKKEEKVGLSEIAHRQGLLHCTSGRCTRLKRTTSVFHSRRGDLGCGSSPPSYERFEINRNHIIHHVNVADWQLFPNLQKQVPCVNEWLTASNVSENTSKPSSSQFLLYINNLEPVWPLFWGLNQAK